MPEGPEIRIMSDFITNHSKNHKFTKIYHVARGNNETEFEEMSKFPSEFNVHSDFYGKKIILEISNSNYKLPIFIFMGMSGSWKIVPTESWNDTKFVRLRIDRNDGQSLLLYGGYLGPKYSLYHNFKGSKTGACMIKDFDKFESFIINNIDNKSFSKPIYELLLDQNYFNGVGNYLRSTIIYYANINPFYSSREIIKKNPEFLKLCKEILETSYSKNGGQLKDWINPFQKESNDFDNWVFYQKGSKIVDKNGRTFWYDPKWDA